MPLTISQNSLYFIRSLLQRFPLSNKDCVVRQANDKSGTSLTAEPGEWQCVLTASYKFISAEYSKSLLQGSPGQDSRHRPVLIVRQPCIQSTRLFVHGHTIFLSSFHRQWLWQEQGKRAVEQRHTQGASEEESVRTGRFSTLPACTWKAGGNHPAHQRKQGCARGGRDRLWKNYTGGSVQQTVQHLVLTSGPIWAMGGFNVTLWQTRLQSLTSVFVWVEHGVALHVFEC